MSTATVRELGAISAAEAYPKAVFMRRVGMTRSSFASACREGLRTVKIGKRSHVLGADWLTFLASRPGGGA